MLDTPSLGFTMQEITGAEAGERNVSVPAEIALPPTCPAQLLFMAILPSRPLTIQLPATLPTCFAKKKDTESKKSKRECMEDKIHEMHLIVLTKESKKLEMETENLLLEREKLQLEIKKLKSSQRGGVRLLF